MERQMTIKREIKGTLRIIIPSGIVLVSNWKIKMLNKYTRIITIGTHIHTVTIKIKHKVEITIINKG